MRMHLINLARHPERLARMRRIGEQLGFEWDLFDAIDATGGHPDQHRFDPDNRLSGAEFGCYLSHRTLWQQIAVGDEPMAAIFEDDIHCMPDLRAVLDDLPMRTQPSHYRLEGWITRVMVDTPARISANGRSLYSYRESLPGTAAYVINRQAARHLLAASTRFHTPTDLIFHPAAPLAAHCARIERFVCIPAPCIQDQLLGSSPTEPCLASSITRTDWRPQSYTGIRKLVRELSRPFRVASTALTDRLRNRRAMENIYG